MTWPCLANPFSLSILQAGLGKNANQLDKLPLSITSFLRTFFNWWTWTFTMTQSSWQRQSCALQFNSDAPSFKLTAWSLPEHMSAKFQAWPMGSAKDALAAERMPTQHHQPGAHKSSTTRALGGHQTGFGFVLLFDASASIWNQCQCRLHSFENFKTNLVKRIKVESRVPARLSRGSQSRA